METVIPFSQMIEGEQVNGQYGYQLQADLEQLSMMMLDSSEIEVKVVLNLNALLVMQWEEDLIQEIQTREPESEKTGRTAWNRMLCGTAQGYSVGIAKSLYYNGGYPGN